MSIDALMVERVTYHATGIATAAREKRTVARTVYDCQREDFLRSFMSSTFRMLGHGRRGLFVEGCFMPSSYSGEVNIVAAAAGGRAGWVGCGWIDCKFVVCTL